MTRSFKIFPSRPITRPAFLLHTAELANHYAPIWDQLSPCEFDVLLTEGAQLDERHLKPGWNARVRNAKKVLWVGEKYEVLVSNHPVKLGRRTRIRRIPKLHALATCNLRMMYAAGKSGWNMAGWNRLYDGVLCFGPHHAEAFSNGFGLPTFQMGYPRFDKYFRSDEDKQTLHARFNCDPEKPTVVWLPTWKNLSSVDHFNDEIAALRPEFNIVVKVHPLMPADEPERVERLRKLGFNALITDTSDNVPLYQLADVMLFDYGGPPFGAIYTDKRFVLLNVPGAAQDELAGDRSPDVLLRKTLLNLDPGTGQLGSHLKNEAHWDTHMQEIARLRNVYFADNFGTSAKAAAAAILDRSWLGS